MKLLALIVFLLALMAGIDLWLAQLAVWGLSLFHVDSGIWGPYFLLGALGGTMATAVAIGKGD